MENRVVAQIKTKKQKPCPTCSEPHGPHQGCVSAWLADLARRSAKRKFKKALEVSESALMREPAQNEGYIEQGRE